MRRTALILEEDPALRDTLATSLSPLAGELQVLAVGELDEAWRLAETTRLDLVVVDLASDGLDGFTLAARLLRMQQHVPLLAITQPSAPTPSQDVEERQLRTLRQPFDAARLREQVSSLLARSPRGHLSGLSAAGILQLLSLEARSAVLVLETPAGCGRLVIQEGRLVHAEALGARGEEAVFRIADALVQPECEILLEELTAPVERTILRSLEGVLLEAAKLRDERRHGMTGERSRPRPPQA